MASLRLDYLVNLGVPMKLSRHPAAPPAPQPVSLARPDGSEWVFLLSPLPLGFHRRLRDRGLSLPVPPLRVARDSHGRPLRDAAGLAVMHSDEQDSQFISDRDLYHQRVAILAIAEALRHDPTVQFSSAVPADTAPAESWPEYADALYSEFAEAGFTDGDLMRLCDEICRLSNLIDDHLARAQTNFSPPPPLNTT